VRDPLPYLYRCVRNAAVDWGRRRRRESGRRATISAACLAAAIGIWAYWAARLPEKKPGPGPGSDVRLAGGIRLEPLGPSDYELIGPRRVRLDRGEIYLAVDPAPDAGPFVVETAAAEVRAEVAHCYISSNWTDGSSATIPIHGTEGGQEMIRSTAHPRLLTTVLVVAGVAQLISPQGSVTGSQIPFHPDPDWLVQALDKTTGFRLMGRRFTPDCYAMGKLVFPTVGRPNNDRTDMFTCVRDLGGPARGFPRGLDLMALLGSHRAEHWLAELGDNAYGTGTDLDKDKNLRYDVVLDGLKREFSPLTPGQWNRNIYWSWLYTLQSLLKDYGRGYPTFMTTDAWQDKSMNTALASWAQLRHDTILYAKQPVTEGEIGATKPVEGYVEPAAEFYARLLATTRMTLAGLRAMDVLEPAAMERLAKLETIIARILRISQEELVHKELSKEDYDFIRRFGTRLKWFRVREEALLEETTKARAAGDEQRMDELRLQLYGDPPPMKTTLIADVYRYAGVCLEEGTGNVDLLVACYLQPDGRLVLGAGPVLSYYEFKHPASDRLTDEKWRHLLRTAPPPLPEWTGGYRVALGIGDCPARSR